MSLISFIDEKLRTLERSLDELQREDFSRNFSGLPPHVAPYQCADCGYVGVYGSPENVYCVVCGSRNVVKISWSRYAELRKKVFMDRLLKMIRVLELMRKIALYTTRVFGEGYLDFDDIRSKLKFDPPSYIELDLVDRVCLVYLHHFDEERKRFLEWFEENILEDLKKLSIKRVLILVEAEPNIPRNTMETLGFTLSQGHYKKEITLIQKEK